MSLKRIFLSAALTMSGASLVVPEARACLGVDVLKPAQQVSQGWKSSNHPLVWSVIQTSTSSKPFDLRCPGMAFNELSQRLQSALSQANTVVMLGEVHDNDAIHAARAALIGSAKVVAFEQLSRDVQPALDAFRTTQLSNPALATGAALKEAIEWEKSPWSKTADYGPLFDRAIALGVPIYAADPQKQVIRRMSKEGIAVLGEQEQARLALDQPLAPVDAAASLAEIEASHCGMIPKAAHPAMAIAQRFRDATMADTVLAAVNAHGNAVLIAGNGHVRADRGVAWYLKRRAPDLKIVTVLFQEVDDARLTSASIAPLTSDSAVADYIVLAPHPDREKDPCDGMREAGSRN